MCQSGEGEVIILFEGGREGVGWNGTEWAWVMKRMGGVCVIVVCNSVRNCISCGEGRENLSPVGWRGCENLATEALRRMTGIRALFFVVRT